MCGPRGACLLCYPWVSRSLDTVRKVWIVCASVFGVSRRSLFCFISRRKFDVTGNAFGVEGSGFRVFGRFNRIIIFLKETKCFEDII